MDSAGGHGIRFLPDGAVAPFAHEDTVLDHAVRAGVFILSPCGGEGRCGKCRVVVDGPADGGDDDLLSSEDLRAGVRLACRCRPREGAVSVTILPESRPARLAALTDGADRDEDADPFIPLYPAPAAGRPLGVALDLGTSTLSGALVSLDDGAVIARSAADNPQMACGQDLFSRIVFAEEHTDGEALLRGMLAAGIEKVVADLLRAPEAQGEVVEVLAAGNTVMSHILFGLSPSPVRKPPYRPVLREYPVKTGRDLGIIAAREAQWRIVPSVGGFVGGDVVSGLLASGMHRDAAVSLFIDVGTNGEVVLGNRDWRIACSSSAGPAFEGGEIACGVRAFPGAIDSVRIDRAGLVASWTVIGGGRPRGICGSGILDLCAELFRVGLLDRAGRLVRRGSASLRDTERGEAYIVAESGRTATGAPILFAAPDVKSVLRTKAALCAAADALLHAAGLPREAVERVFAAGGFGSFLDLRSALVLGLFPPFPLRTFVTLGNASLAGAVGALRNRRRWKEAVGLAAATSHHDLHSDPRFMELYQRALFIPHADEEGYRTILAPETKRR
jgi:uncharacterized 2Fe-2S/4Fe-4S cluster protein (DUF4445 family)